MPFDALRCREQKEARWTLGHSSPLRLDHVVHSLFTGRDDENAEAGEAPHARMSLLFSRVGICDQLATQARLADEAIAPDVHRAAVELEGKVVPRTIIIEKREQAIGHGRDQYVLSAVANGNT